MNGMEVRKEERQIKKKTKIHIQNNVDAEMLHVDNLGMEIYMAT